MVLLFVKYHYNLIEFNRVIFSKAYEAFAAQRQGQVKITSPVFIIGEPPAIYLFPISQRHRDIIFVLSAFLPDFPWIDSMKSCLLVLWCQKVTIYSCSYHPASFERSFWVDEKMKIPAKNKPGNVNLGVFVKSAYRFLLSAVS